MKRSRVISTSAASSTAFDLALEISIWELDCSASISAACLNFLFSISLA